MAHSLSSKKRIRQNEKHRLLNRARRSTLKSKLRSVSNLLQKGAGPEVADTVKSAVQVLDREANRGTLHPNAAARHKSRLARRLNALQAKPGA